jgi:type IV pilus assembly protein PilV
MRSWIAAPSRKARARQRGFSLLEVLIALLVLSLGLLGLAALQTFGLKFTYQSYQRTQATYLIGDIIERMRANPVGTRNNGYLIGMTGSAPAPSQDCLTSTCTATEMAQFDLDRWLTTVSSVLAQGQGEVSERPSGAPLYDIRVSWREHDLNMTQTVTVQLP